MMLMYLYVCMYVCMYLKIYIPRPAAGEYAIPHSPYGRGVSYNSNYKYIQAKVSIKK